VAKKDNHLAKYRGESATKKIQRLVFWNAVKREVGSRKFNRGPHLVLSSSEAGDVSTLLGMGVQPDGIVAVDIDRHAVAAAQWKFPGLDIRHENVVDAVQGRRWKSVYLDFCSPLSGKSMSVVAKCMPHLGGSVLGVAMLACREQSIYRDGVAELKAANITHEKQRPVLFQKMLPEVVQTHRFYPTNWWYYLSHDDIRFGKPMFVGMGTVMAKPTHSSSKRLARLTRVQRVDYNPASFAIAVTDAYRKDEWRALRLYNMRRQTVAALQAHVTRGSYR
jgi:hypothetical protein